MEKKVVRAVTAMVMVLTIAISFILLNYSDLHVYALQTRAKQMARAQAGYSVLDLMRDETAILEDSNTTVLKKQLRLEVPKGVSIGDIKIDNQYVYQVVEIQIPNIDDSYFFDYPMLGSCDHIEDITFETSAKAGVIDITLDSVYELDVEVEENYIHIGFLDPHTLYDTIIVVDAGHGGNAPGATKQGVNEKDIDLAIVKELQKLLDKNTDNIGVYYTRTDDSNPSLESRAALANKLSADLFLSVHNNSTASGRMSSINGTEVMYCVADKSGKSKQFAEICLQHLLDTLGSKSKGVVAGDDIYLIRTAKMPVALVEVGFMTNQEELKKLKSSAYQKDTAQALYDALMESLEVLNE